MQDSRQRRFNKDHCTSSVQLSLDVQGLEAVISSTLSRSVSVARLLLDSTSLARHSRFNQDLCIPPVQLQETAATNFLKHRVRILHSITVFQALRGSGATTTVTAARLFSSQGFKDSSGQPQ
jgi:hypothetical protein